MTDSADQHKCPDLGGARDRGPSMDRRSLVAAGLGAGIALAPGTSGAASPSSATATTVVAVERGRVVARTATGSVIATGGAAHVINAAIARTTRTGGGSVYLAAATYRLSAPITLLPGVHLFGAGAFASPDFAHLAGTILQADPARFPATQAAVRMGALGSMQSGLPAAEISHLGIDGAGHADTGLVVAGRNCRVHRLLVVGTQRVGVHITNGPIPAHDTYVAVNLVDSVISMQSRAGTTGLLIANAYPRGNSATDHLIAHNRILHCGAYQIHALDAGGGTQYIGNHTTTAEVGWVVTSGSTITGNYIDSCTAASIIVDGDAVTITGNHFTPRPTNSPVIVIARRPQAGVSVTANTVQQGVRSASSFVSATAPTVRNLVVLGNVGHGVLAATDFGAENNYVAGNLFSG